MTHLLETFEMSIDHQEDGLVVISMPVTDKVKQPFGICDIMFVVREMFFTRSSLFLVYTQTCPSKTMIPDSLNVKSP